MQKFKVKREWYSEHFKEFLESKNRYQILYGGRGSGKTHHIILKLISISFIQQYNHIVYVNKIFGDIRKNQFKDIIKVLKATNLIEYFTINKTNYGFKNNITGTEFTALGMDNAENTKGLSDPTIIWWDEVNKGTQDDFTTLNALLRTPLNPNYQFIISFNPVAETSWLRTYFFEKSNAYKVRDDFKDVYLNHSTYNDNDFIDKEKYLESLTLNSIGNQNKMLVDIKGLWGVLDITNPFFYAYKKDLHYSYSSYQPTNEYFLDISFDFNITPCTALIGQHNRNTKTYNVFDLILTDVNTMQGNSALKSLCIIIKKKYIDTGLFVPYRIRVTGDASGRNGSADREINNTFYNTIREILKVPEQNFYVRKANLQHVTSAEVCNAVLTTIPINHFTIFDIPELDTDINSAYFDIKQTLDEAKKKHGLHIVDAFRYLIDFWFGMENKRFLKKFDEISYNITNIKKRIENE
jgi:PBSX family phage terminase large subunit